MEGEMEEERRTTAPPTPVTTMCAKRNKTKKCKTKQTAKRYKRENVVHHKDVFLF